MFFAFFFLGKGKWMVVLTDVNMCLRVRAYWVALVVRQSRRDSCQKVSWFLLFYLNIERNLYCFQFKKQQSCLSVSQTQICGNSPAILIYKLNFRNLSYSKQPHHSGSHQCWWSDAASWPAFPTDLMAAPDREKPRSRELVEVRISRIYTQQQQQQQQHSHSHQQPTLSPGYRWELNLIWT